MKTTWMKKTPQQVAALQVAQWLEVVDIDYNELFTDNAEPEEVEEALLDLLIEMEIRAGERSSSKASEED